MTTRTPSLIDRHIASKMLERRRQIGLAQEKVADMLGTSYQMVQKYEQGKNRMTGDRLYQIARILRVDVGFFFHDMPPTPEPVLHWNYKKRSNIATQSSSVQTNSATAASAANSERQ